MKKSFLWAVMPLLNWRLSAAVQWSDPKTDRTEANISEPSSFQLEALFKHFLSTFSLEFEAFPALQHNVDYSYIEHTSCLD